MNGLRKLMLVLCGFAAAGLGVYEVVCKSDAWLGEPLPGWYEAQRIERRTPFVPRTGRLAVDLVIHESEEAAAYYAYLLRPGPRSASPVSRSPRMSR